MRSKWKQKCGCAKETISFIEEKMPDYVSPEMWPPNSPDLNPVDYGIWESLSQKVYRNPITDIESLKKALKKAWKEFPQCEIDFLYCIQVTHIVACIPPKEERRKTSF